MLRQANMELLSVRLDLLSTLMAYTFSLASDSNAGALTETRCCTGDCAAVHRQRDHYFLGLPGAERDLGGRGVEYGGAHRTPRFGIWHS